MFEVKLGITLQHRDCFVGLLNVYRHHCLYLPLHLAYERINLVLIECEPSDILENLLDNWVKLATLDPGK